MDDLKREKICLNEANEFLKRAAKDIDFTTWRFGTEGQVNMTATMLGNLAADKFRNCMTAEARGTKTPAAKPR